MSLETFFEEANGSWKINPLNRYEYFVGMAVMTISSCPGHSYRVQLDYIKSLEQGKGHASGALRELCKLADKHEVEIELCVHPLPWHSLNTKLAFNKAKLRSWYSRHNFVATSQRYMVRKPTCLVS